MPRIEKIIAEKNYDEDKKYNILSFGQKGLEPKNKKILNKELLEDSSEKAGLRDLLIENLVTKLNLPENYEILDEVVGEKTRKNLTDKLYIYIDRLGSKNIVPNNSVKDIVNNISSAMLLDIIRLNKINGEKINKKDKNKEEGRMEKEKRKEEQKKFILKEFNALDDYISMLLSDRNFENMELTDPFGYMKERIKNKEDEKKLRFLRVNPVAFVEEIKKTLTNN